MFQVGITGGIGSGKTTVCKIFELLGVPVFYADTEAKKLYESNEELKKMIIRHFGEDLYTNGKFNKIKMSQIVFNDTEKLNLLNHLVHPIVKSETAHWVQKQKGPYVIKEAALLIEAGNASQCDEIILVVAPIETRISRIMSRDQMQRDAILNRIKTQMSDDEKMVYAQHTVYNDEEHLLIPQVMQLHQYFTKNAGADVIAKEP